MSTATDPYVPDDTEDLCEALMSGWVCKIPSRHALRILGPLDARGLKATIEQCEDPKWTLVIPAP